MSDLILIMQWPVVACVLLPGILVYLGLHIVQREVIFVDLALAQVAALGHSVAILVGHDAHDWQTYGWAFALTLIGAALFALTRTRKHRVPQEALIGIVYVVAAAAGLLLLSKTIEGKEELQRTLVGEILVVQPAEIWRTAALYALVAVAHVIFRKKFLTITFDPERAVNEGMAIRWWDFLFYALFGLVVTTFVHIAGVLLVFSYLIVPAVCANFIARGLAARIVTGWIIAGLASVLGLYGSFRLDVPSGAAIVCALGAALVVVAVAAELRPGAPAGDTK